MKEPIKVSHLSGYDFEESVSKACRKAGLDMIPLKDLLFRAGIRIEKYEDEKGRNGKRLWKEGEILLDACPCHNSYTGALFIALKELGHVT